MKRDNDSMEFLENDDMNGDKSSERRNRVNPNSEEIFFQKQSSKGFFEVYGFNLKDFITIFSILLGLFSVWMSTNTRIVILEQKVTTLEKTIDRHIESFEKFKDKMEQQFTDLRMLISKK